MNNIQKIFLWLTLPFIFSCSTDEQFQEISRDSANVTAVLADWNLEDEVSRTSITTGAYPTAPSPVWVTGDSIGIYPDAGGDQLSFRINEGGSKTCTFDGGGWAMKSASYTAYSPFKRSYYYKKKNALPISMLKQTQKGNDNADHLGAYDIQIAKGEKPETDGLVFEFTRKVALVRLEITAPTAATWSSVSLESDALFTTEAKMNLDLESPTVTSISTSNIVTLNLENVSTTNENLSIIAYMMLLPVDLTGKTLSVKLTDSGGVSYSTSATITNNKTNLSENSARWITASFEETIPNNQIWYTSSDGNVVTPKKTSDFGANIISNVYENGKGIITFDGNITSIGYQAFSYCNTLTSISIPKSIATIGESAFKECQHITEFEIPNSVTTIEEFAFSGCTGLTSVNIPNSVTAIGDYAFNVCNNLADITIGNNVATIGKQAFGNCHYITEIEIPNSVTTIKEGAFESCYNLDCVTIPENVTNIGSEAFSGCDNLANFHSKALVPPILGENALDTWDGYKFITLDCKFYVPAESLEAYKAADYWKDLNIKPINQ